MLLTPHWIYYLFGALMFAVAGYSALLLAVGATARRTAGVDVELSHVVMGLAMAGRFMSSWAFGGNLLWELSFGALVVWFLTRATRSVQRNGLHFPHTLIHAFMSFAMLIMYWFPASMAGRATGASGAIGGGMGSKMAAQHADSGLLFVLAVALFASAVFTLASPRKGWVVYGSAQPASAVASADTDGSVTEEVEAVVTQPRLVDMTHVVMCVAMGFMLILML